MRFSTLNGQAEYGEDGCQAAERSYMYVEDKRRSDKRRTAEHGKNRGLDFERAEETLRQCTSSRKEGRTSGVPESLDRKRIVSTKQCRKRKQAETE